LEVDIDVGQGIQEDSIEFHQANRMWEEMVLLLGPLGEIKGRSIRI